MLYTLHFVQVFIHNSGGRTQKGGRLEMGTQGDISLLNVNQIVTSITAGRLDPSSSQDVLVIGTQSNLLAYDVLNNKDVFYKEVVD